MAASMFVTATPLMRSIRSPFSTPSAVQDGGLANLGRIESCGVARAGTGVGVFATGLGCSISCAVASCCSGSSAGCDAFGTRGTEPRLPRQACRLRLATKVRPGPRVTRAARPFMRLEEASQE